ncbi:MAG: SDR family NAD(P)-dependent oxidoreductase, partial [Leeuwenhoekiella sp.]
MWNLNSKTALVTGGTKGIGKATVEEFLNLGATVIFTARTAEDILKMEKGLDKYHGKVFGFASDVSKAEDLKDLHIFVSEKFNKLDVLVNNAGINIRKPTLEYSAAEHDKIIAINLSAPFHICRLFYN